MQRGGCVAFVSSSLEGPGYPPTLFSCPDWPHLAIVAHPSHLPSRYHRQSYRSMAKASFGSLPDELLLLVIANVFHNLEDTEGSEWTYTHNKLLLTMTAVFKRLRALVIQIPHIWADVIFEGRRTAWMELCITRAKQSPISMHLEIRLEHRKFSSEMLRKYLSRVRSLEIYVSGRPYEESLRLIIDSIDFSCLHNLHLRTYAWKSIGYHEIYSLQSAHNLTSLRVSSTSLAELPTFPALQKLALSYTSIQDDNLYQLLMSSPQLSDIDFDVLNLSQWHGHIIRPAHLPRLRNLSVTVFNPEEIVPTLSIVPNPSHKLNIAIKNVIGPWEISDDIQTILDRVEEFRDSALSGTSLAPVLIATAWARAISGHDEGVPVSLALRDTWDKTPSLICTWDRAVIMRTDPFLNSVTAIHVRHKTLRDGGVDTSPLDICPNAENLVIRKEARDAWDETIQDRDEVERELKKTAHDLDEYIRKRRDEGRPFKSFTVEVPWGETSASWRSMFERLVAEYGSECVTWAAGKGG
jgi:hypothetical protein